MSRRSTQACLHLLKLSVIAVIVLLATSHGHAQRAAAAATSPFAGLAGPWTGSGTVTLKGGTKERIRCRATYNVSSSQDNLRQELRCASDSYKFVLRSDVSHRNGALSGRWSESTNNLAGTVDGTVRGATIAARIAGDIFSALVAVATRGNSQHVTITSPGSKLERVTISLRRSQ
jgi:hypothetical protein